MMYYPLQCYIELTQKCNLRCAHCFAEGSPDNNAMLSLNDIKQIYAEIEKLGVVYVNISGGEPLLNDQLFDIIQFVATKPYDTCLLTNGTLWNEDYIEKLKIADPMRKVTIQMSMDGNYETMLRQRNISSEQYNNIFKTMKELKKAGFKVTTLLVADSITSDILIETAFKLLKEQYVDSAQIVPLFITGRAIKNIQYLDDFWKKWFSIVKNVTCIKRDMLWNELSNKINIGFFNLYELVIPLISSNMEKEIYEVWGLDLSDIDKYRNQIRRPFYCEAGKSEIVVSSKKEIFPCVASIRTDLNCGNMNEKTLSAIWKDSDTLNYFRNPDNFACLIEPCLSCRFKEFCGGGCKLTSLALYGDLEHIDQRCPMVVEYKLKNE